MSIGDTIDTVGDSLRSFLGGLTPRDRMLFGVMVAVVVLMLGWFAMGALRTQTKNLKSQLASAQQAQTQVNMLMAEYADISGEAVGLEARLEAGKGFSPASWLEKLAADLGITANLKSIKETGTEQRDFYQAQKVDVLIDNIDLRQLVKLLHKIQEAPQALRLGSLRVKTNPKTRSELDVRFELAVLKPVEG